MTLYALTSLSGNYIATISVENGKVEYTDMDIVVYPDVDSKQQHIAVIEEIVTVKARVVEKHITYSSELYDIGRHTVKAHDYSERSIYAGLMINVATNYRKSINT